MNSKTKFEIFQRQVTIPFYFVGDLIVIGSQVFP